MIGVGATDAHLTLGAMRAVQATNCQVVLRTECCGIKSWLDEQRITYEALDALYDQYDDFDQLNLAIVKRVVALAAKTAVCYCVHDLRDASVRLLMDKHASKVDLVPGAPLDGALTALADGACLTLSAADHIAFQPEAGEACMVREIDSREVASELKLRLMERYPEQLKVTLLLPDGCLKSIELCALDRQPDAAYSHLLACFIPKVHELTALSRYGFNELNRVMVRLRAPDGCPWDRKQTHESLTANVVEEAYEVVDAIERGDIDSLYDELGDLLLQVTLHAEIARQHGEFTIDDVTSAVVGKLISRHEHIFGLAKADTPEEVLMIWERAKKREKSLDTLSDAMRAVTHALPQLMRAAKVQKKAAGVGFDWDDPMPALDKVIEEAEELREAIVKGSSAHQTEELGDLLFACVNVSRLIRQEPELALAAATDKFIRRFEAMEALILKEKGSFEGMSLADMDEYWNKIKKIMLNARKPDEQAGI